MSRRVKNFTKKYLIENAKHCNSLTALAERIEANKLTLNRYLKIHNLSKENLPLQKNEVWNKGLTKKNDERIKKYYSDHPRTGKNNPMFGKNPWNKGLTKENNKSLQQISESHLGKKCQILQKRR